MSSVVDRRTETAIRLGIAGLARFVSDGMTIGLEPVRLARAAYALIQAGCSVKGDLFARLVSYIVGLLREDGGWTDIEETIWCLACLRKIEGSGTRELHAAAEWLASTHQSSGGWGKTARDRARIPITGLVIALIPDLASNCDFEWIVSQWQADLSSPTRLTYKGAFSLHAMSVQKRRYLSLLEETIDYLRNEQEADGGFGPWKGHPAGSDPWTTGVVVWGLSGVVNDCSRHSLEMAVSWLRSKQLPNGLWPYHYLDDGTAMALIGLSTVLPKHGGVI